jgi:hypothetical protein
LHGFFGQGEKKERRKLALFSEGCRQMETGCKVLSVLSVSHIKRRINFYTYMFSLISFINDFNGLAIKDGFHQATDGLL